MYKLTAFSERLGELMDEKAITPKMLCDDLGYHEIYNWLSTNYLPSVDNLIKLADYFKCSLGFLIGIEAESDSNDFKQCPPFAEQLRLIISEKKITIYRLSKKSKIYKTTIYDWLHGRHVPRLDNLMALAAVLDCSLDHLLGREK